MDYGGCDRRKTKGDLKKKRLNRGYKRGGQFRTHEVNEETGERRDKMGKLIEDKGNKKNKKRKKKR